jgi:Rps23 Pro-64 3,4-dihydroxylase Tpa1-like proline 4-hydroxylase
MSEPEISNFNTIIKEIIKKSLFTERQIEIILKQKKMLDVEFNVSKGAYYRQLAQSRSKIESVYYTLILLQALDVILTSSDVISRLAEQVNVMKDGSFTPENEDQIIDVIQKTVKQLVDV